MNTAIRFYTRSGNTQKLAKAIADRIGTPALGIDSALDEKVDILFLGCSYYAFDMDPKVKSFLRENKDNIGSVALFGTSALMKSMKKPMKRVLDELGIALLEDEFHCRGKFGPMHTGRPNTNDLREASAFAQKVISGK